MATENPPVVELSPREKGFTRRIMVKYPDGVSQDKDLFRSIAIISLIVLAFHLIEQFVPTNWLGLLIVYPPTIWMFTRYRKFSIFRSCLISKLGSKLSKFEPIERPGSTSSTHPHPHAHR